MEQPKHSQSQHSTSQSKHTGQSLPKFVIQQTSNGRQQCSQPRQSFTAYGTNLASQRRVRRNELQSAKHSSSESIQQQLQQQQSRQFEHAVSTDRWNARPDKTQQSAQHQSIFHVIVHQSISSIISTIQKAIKITIDILPYHAVSCVILLISSFKYSSAVISG